MRTLNEQAIKPVIDRAQPGDADILREVAIQSKGHWGYPAHWMDQFVRSPIITPQSIAGDVVYTACVQGVVVCWYRLLPQTPTAILDDLWVLPAWIGRRIGMAMFQHLVTQAQWLGAQAIELDADPNAVPFYQRMGFHVIGQSLSDWGRHIPHMRYDLL